MKKIVFLFLLTFVSITVFAQQPLSYSKVIEAKDLDKTSIYVAVRQWFSATYNDANEVIVMDDKDAGIIMGNGATKYSKGGLTYACYDGYLKYAIKVQVRDGRYKVDITSIRHEALPGKSKECSLGLITDSEEQFTKGMGKKYMNNVVKDIQETMKVHSESLFADLEEATSNAGTAADSGDDW